jgi:hypothetical protein
MNNTIRALQNEFDTAELNADTETLQRLIADDFLSIGPKGFVLDKQEWIDRHGHFTYDALDIDDIDIRLYDNTAIVSNIQRNKASYKDQHVELALRVSQTWVHKEEQWQLAAIQFSPLANGL